jgi:hypothetical protein
MGGFEGLAIAGCGAAKGAFDFAKPLRGFATLRTNG